MNLYSPIIVTEHIAYWKKLPFFTTLPRLKNWLLYPIWFVYTFFYLKKNRKYRVLTSVIKHPVISVFEKCTSVSEF